MGPQQTQTIKISEAVYERLIAAGSQLGTAADPEAAIKALLLRGPFEGTDDRPATLGDVRILYGAVIELKAQLEAAKIAIQSEIDRL